MRDRYIEMVCIHNLYNYLAIINFNIITPYLYKHRVYYKSTPPPIGQWLE